MRIIRCLLFTLLLPWLAKADPVSFETYQKLSPQERDKLLNSASPETQEAARKAERHRGFLQLYGGEAGLKAFREQQVAAKRGVGEFEGLLTVQLMWWQSYAGEKDDENKQAGMKGQTLVNAYLKLSATEDAKVKALRERQSQVHALAFHLAPTPEARALSQRARELADAMQLRTANDGTQPVRPITDAERAKFDRQVDVIYAAVQKLPLLPARQAEKEYDALTEDQLIFVAGE